MIVALGMAEIVSAIPTSGGPYFWAAILAPKEKAAFYSWVTGWWVISQNWTYLIRIRVGGLEAHDDLGSTSLAK